MDEQAQQLERRMIHRLRPRVSLSYQTEEDLLNTVESFNGRDPYIVGAYVTRTVMVDAAAYHDNAYTQTLSPQARSFADYRRHVPFGVERTAKNQGARLPSALELNDRENGTVLAALRPRNQSALNAVAHLLDFSRYERSETLRPYVDSSPVNGQHYIIAQIANAQLDPSERLSERKRRIKRFTDAAALGQYHYATTLEIEGKDLTMDVPVRPMRLPRFALGSYDTGQEFVA